MNRLLAEMSSLDIFLLGFSQFQYNDLKHTIRTPNASAMPLLSWDIFTLGLQSQSLNSQKKLDCEKVLSFAQRFDWQNDIRSTFADNDYEALIITDKDQNIIWVNEGFTKMTGYSKKEALKKTPRFLQGPKTSLSAKKRIKSKLAIDKPFLEVITNHRKDNSTYKCQVKIFPLYGKETTHYIAFEKQVS